MPQSAFPEYARARLHCKLNCIGVVVAGGVVEHLVRVWNDSGRSLLNMQARSRGIRCMHPISLTRAVQCGRHGRAATVRDARSHDQSHRWRSGSCRERRGAAAARATAHHRWPAAACPSGAVGRDRPVVGALCTNASTLTDEARSQARLVGGVVAQA